MSKGFHTWVETWIRDHVFRGNADIESYQARAERLTEKMFAEAAAAGFSKVEIEEERTRVLHLILAVVSADHEFDIDRYRLAWQLAMEHEDGD